METGGILPFDKNLSLVSIVSQLNNWTHLFSLRIVLILSSYQPVGLSSELFPSSSNTLFSILFSKNFSVCLLKWIIKFPQSCKTKHKLTLLVFWCFYY